MRQEYTIQQKAHIACFVILWIALLFFAVVMVFTMPASAAATTPLKSITPTKYTDIKNKIDAGSEGLVWSSDGTTLTVAYRIANIDTTAFSYVARVYTNGHTQILYERNLTASSGSASISIDRIPEGTYWINMQRWAKNEDQYCARVGYPCEIGKNLDIIRLDIGNVTVSGNEYQQFIKGAIQRSGQPVKGAAWTTA